MTVSREEAIGVAARNLRRDLGLPYDECERIAESVIIVATPAERERAAPVERLRFLSDAVAGRCCGNGNFGDGHECEKSNGASPLPISQAETIKALVEALEPFAELLKEEFPDIDRYGDESGSLEPINVKMVRRARAALALVRKVA